MILTGERMILNRMRKETEIEHLCRYQYAKQFVAGKKVLDAACGSGYGTKILAEDAGEVVGMDISSEAIAYARNEYMQSNTRYVVGSVEKLPFEDQVFDVIVSFETIEHVNETIQNAFLNEIKRVLKEDGILIMSTPNKKKFTDERGGKLSEYHIKEFYVEEFRDFLNKQFNYVVLEQQFYAQAACIVGKSTCQAQIEGFKDEGMYVIAVASDTALKDIVRNSVIVRYPKEYEKMNDFMQVFYSNTENFIEENSQLVEIDNSKECQKVFIKLDGIKCKYLRIDPITGRGIIRINKIEITLTSGDKILSNCYASNASKEENGTLFFYDKDPQIIMELDEEKIIDSVEIEFLLINIVNGFNGDDAIIHILKENNKNLQQCNEELKLNNDSIKKKSEHLSKENSDLKTENKILQETNNDLQEQLANIYASKTWKIQRAVTKILGGGKEE